MLDDGKQGDYVSRAIALVDEAVRIQEIVWVQTDASEDLFKLGSAYKAYASSPLNTLETKIMYIEKAVDCYSKVYQRTRRDFHWLMLSGAEGELKKLKAQVPQMEDDPGEP